MAKLPDWIVEARNKDRNLVGYAGDPDDEKACRDYDFRRAMLWEQYGSDLIRKVELQADEDERLELDLEGERLWIKEGKKLHDVQVEKIEQLRGTIKLLLGQQADVSWRQVADSDVDAYVLEYNRLAAEAKEAATLPGKE